MGKPTRLSIASILCTVSALLVLGTLRPRAAEAASNPLQSLSCRRIPGTYLVSRDPTSGPSRVLTIFQDGNLSSIQSIQQVQVGVDNGFSDQQGAWECTGHGKIHATVLDFSFDPSGNFRGTSVAHYELQFAPTAHTLTGRVEGKIFSPGVDPLHPGSAPPIDEFTDTFEAQRVSP